MSILFCGINFCLQNVGLGFRVFQGILTDFLSNSTFAVDRVMAYAFAYPGNRLDNFSFYYHHDVLYGLWTPNSNRDLKKKWEGFT